MCVTVCCLCYHLLFPMRPSHLTGVRSGGQQNTCGGEAFQMQGLIFDAEPVVCLLPSLSVYSPLSIDEEV